MFILSIKTNKIFLKLYTGNSFINKYLFLFSMIKLKNFILFNYFINIKFMKYIIYLFNIFIINNHLPNIFFVALPHLKSSAGCL